MFLCRVWVTRGGSELAGWAESSPPPVIGQPIDVALEPSGYDVAVTATATQS